MNKRTWFCRLAMCVLLIPAALVAAPAAKEEGGAAKEESPDFQAMRMLRKGMALLDDRQDERAVKLISSIPLNFPKSEVRFAASLLLGKYYSDKGDFQLPIKSLSPVMDAESADPDQRAEALYRMGICYYGLSDYNRSLSTLRRVTEEYPWSVYANESYYYIGLCHFQLKRWRKAVEALKLVGTSVPPNTKSQNFVEAGQRFFVKVQDKDLRAVKNTGGTLSVRITTESGDSETLPMAVFDTDGETYLGSVKTELGKPVPNDGKLQIRGGDVISVDYVDENTQDGARSVKRVASSRVVSTAVAGFMNGAFREYVHGVFAEQPTFIRVKDFDADVSDQKDKVKVRVYSQYKPQVGTEDAPKDAAAESEGETEYQVRDRVEMTLEETEPHSGYFAGQLVVDELKDATNMVNREDAKLTAHDKDMVCVEYIDAVHFGGTNSPRTVLAKADFLTGQIPDVSIAHREVTTEDLRARKNLIEARFYQRLAQIFGDVGLMARAKEKADIGLEKADDVLRRSLRGSVDQSLIEDAYKAKWDLLLAKGDLNGAIRACQTLMALYPASSIADVAMMQIARANLEAKKTPQALQILNGVLGLKGSPDLKAEAQFLIGTVLEENVNKELPKDQRLKALGQAMEAFKTCADKYPSSPFAGQALGKVIDFHMDAKDYDRCLELLQTVFVDFPDAPFLDDMLLKWGVVLAQMKKYDEAKEKLQQLLSDYPNSRSAGKAQKVLEMIGQKTSGG